MFRKFSKQLFRNLSPELFKIRAEIGEIGYIEAKVRDIAYSDEERSKLLARWKA